MHFRPILAFVVLMLLLRCNIAGATEFCATNSVQLSTALSTAATNGEDDVIKVAVGTYNAGGFAAFVYSPATLSNGDDKDLTIIGGYSEFFGNPCGQRLLDDPLLTVLDAQGIRRVLLVSLRANSSITIRLLTFINGDASGDDPNVDHLGGGLGIRTEDASTGLITIERNAFVDNVAKYGGGLSAASLTSGFGTLRVINNLFVGNSATVTYGAVNLDNRSDQGNALTGIYFTNNTVIDNSAPPSSGTGAGGVRIYGPVGRYVYNNNLWNNTDVDLVVYAPSGDNHDFVLRNNNFATRVGQAPTTADGNISVEPVYEASEPFDYTPVRSSPLVDAGIFAPPPNFSLWYLTDYDLRYADRVVGPNVDIGAYENERIFTNGFENNVLL